MPRRLLRLRASLRRVRGILLFMGAWFALGLAGFKLGGGLSWSESLEAAFFLKVLPSSWAQGYAFWGQSIVFGVFVGLLMRETLENHVERCRAMAGLVSGHTIVVGYSHLGQRLVDHLIAEREAYVLIEKDKELVDELLRRGEPVVVDDARSRDALPAANVGSARRMIIASNNIETALILTKRARDANAALEILVRCNFDDFTDVLEKLGADQVYSTSQVTFEQLKTRFDGAKVTR